MGLNEGYTIRGAFRELNYTSLAKIAQAPETLAMIRAAANHPDVVQNVMSEEQAEIARANIAAANRTGGSKKARAGQPVGNIFARGKIVRHKPSGRRVTIVRAAAGRQRGQTLHEVVDAKTGKRFTAKEVDLSPVS